MVNAWPFRVINCTNKDVYITRASIQSVRWEVFHCHNLVVEYAACNWENLGPSPVWMSYFLPHENSIVSRTNLQQSKMGAVVRACCHFLSVVKRLHKFPMLTHWGLDNIEAVSQTTFSKAFSWMKMIEFRLRFHWSLFPRVKLTISQHWFR